MNIAPWALRELEKAAEGYLPEALSIGFKDKRDEVVILKLQE